LKPSLNRNKNPYFGFYGRFGSLGSADFFEGVASVNLFVAGASFGCFDGCVAGFGDGFDLSLTTLAGLKETPVPLSYILLSLL